MLALLVAAVALCGVWQSAATQHPRSVPAIFDPEPNHIWNRTYGCLFTYAAAVAAQQFAPAYVPRNPQQPFLPAELLRPDGPWVCRSAYSEQPTAIVRSADGRCAWRWKALFGPRCFFSFRSAWAARRTLTAAVLSDSAAQMRAVLPR